MTEQEWNAIKNNDAAYDGQFFYGVVTTNHVCRPSCSARTCNPKNVMIFYSYEDALQHGFVPCQRCHPGDPDWKEARFELAETARNLIEENYKEKFSLDDLSGKMYLNKNYILRTFKSVTGYTPLEYHNYYRCLKAKEMLENRKFSISYISDEVGYASQAHFTRLFKKYFLLSPTEYRKKGLQERGENDEKI